MYFQNLDKFCLQFQRPLPVYARKSMIFIKFLATLFLSEKFLNRNKNLYLIDYGFALSESAIGFSI